MSQRADTTNADPHGEVSIRRTDAGDGEFLRELFVVADIWDSVVPCRPLDAVVHGFLHGDAECFVILVGDARVGVLQCAATSAHPHVLDGAPETLRDALAASGVYHVGYAVHPDWRGRGAATAAVRAVVAQHRAAEPGCAFVALVDHGGASAAALAWVLARCGFACFAESGPGKPSVHALFP